MWLRKSKVPGSVPGFTWESLDDVIEVPEELGLELLAIRDAGFSEAPEPSRVAEQPASGTPAGPDPAEVVEAPTVARRGRPRKNPAEVSE